MKTVVLNPDWTVPTSIIRNEIAPAMARGKNTIAAKGLVATDGKGNPVDASSIDWGSDESERYTLVQPPGSDNALGRVKFLFPNPYSIYLHDTPSKASFEAEKRTFSHGCIRLEHPLELAEILLAGQDSWDAGKIQDVIQQGQTQNVNLEHPLPVVIVYWTVSVGASGEIRYMNDIYHLDPAVLAALGSSGRG
jgi:murein L,D-transpeptidase YcbB/YkuD